MVRFTIRIAARPLVEHTPLGGTSRTQLEFIQDHTGTLSAGNATCLAFGQTGSGKTFTQRHLQSEAAKAIFAALGQRDDRDDVEVLVSFVENCGNRCFDLLNGRNVVSDHPPTHTHPTTPPHTHPPPPPPPLTQVELREDQEGTVHIHGQRHRAAKNAEVSPGTRPPCLPALRFLSMRPIR